MDSKVKKRKLRIPRFGRWLVFLHNGSSTLSPSLHTIWTTFFDFFLAMMNFLSAISPSSASKLKSPSPPSSYSSAPGYLSLRTVVLILLPLLSVAGAYGTWILAGANGTVATLDALAKQDVALLPGSTDLQRRTYTGVGPIDRQLTILVTFFSPVVDVNNGALLLYATFGLGQFGASWAIMMMESMRQGNRRRIVSFVGTVGFILQNITFTVTVPIWLVLHILTSPVAKPFPGSHANSVLLVSTLDLKILPISIILGYLIPTVLMALPSPSITSSFEHQGYIALWQPFPVWCVVIQMSIRHIVNTVAGKTSNKDGPQIALGTSYLKSAKGVYGFILALCMITHLPVLLLAILPSTVFPELSTPLQSLSTHSFSSVYLPYFPTLTHQVPSFAAGVHTFLQWDLYMGGMAMLLWGILLYRNAADEKTALNPKTSLPSYRGLEGGKEKGDGVWGKLFVKITIWIVLAGPSGALAVLLWERDRIVKRKTKEGI